jgi:hypothetical protein
MVSFFLLLAFWSLIAMASFMSIAQVLTMAWNQAMIQGDFTLGVLLLLLVVVTACVEYTS